MKGKTKVDAVKRDLKRKFALYSPRLHKWVRSIVKRESKRAALHMAGQCELDPDEFNKIWKAYQKERGK